MSVRQRRHLDLLPLLDVFMVILFALATMTERELESTTERAQELAADLEAVQKELDTGARARAEADRLRVEVAGLHDRLAEIVDADATLARAEEHRRRDAILGKVLHHIELVEIEISGHTESEGRIINRCCFRTDPLTPAWRTCGLVPAHAVPRATWFDHQALDLHAALSNEGSDRSTLFMIRQDDIATHRIAEKLAIMIRQRVGDDKVYDEDVGPRRLGCPADVP